MEQGKKKSNKKILIIVAVVLVISIICGTTCKIMYDKNKEEQERIAIESKEYIEKLKVISAYLQINEEYSYSCNSTLSNLMTTYTNKSSMIISTYKKLGNGTIDSGAIRKDFFNILKDNNKIIEEKLQELADAPTKELQESYNLLKNSYDNYLKGYELALAPVENYITFTNNTEEYHKSFEKNYNQFKESITDFNIDNELKEAKTYMENRDGFLSPITTSMSFLKTYTKIN